MQKLFCLEEEILKISHNITEKYKHRDRLEEIFNEVSKSKNNLLIAYTALLLFDFNEEYTVKKKILEDALHLLNITQAQSYTSLLKLCLGMNSIKHARNLLKSNTDDRKWYSCSCYS